VRHPGPADLAPRDVSERLGVPLAGVIRSDRRLATMADRGQLHDAVSRTSLGSLASKLLVALHRERKGTAT
jgi:hypothetical protein